jgi:UDP-glucose 4-epimerase
VVIDLGEDDVISLKELADLLIEVNRGGEYRLRDFPADRKRIDIGDYYADFNLVRSVLGWQPQVSLREGLARTLAFYREHLAHYL